VQCLQRCTAAANPGCGTRTCSPSSAARQGLAFRRGVRRLFNATVPGQPEHRVQSMRTRWCTPCPPNRRLGDPGPQDARRNSASASARLLEACLSEPWQREGLTSVSFTAQKPMYYTTRTGCRRKTRRGTTAARFGAVNSPAFVTARRAAQPCGIRVHRGRERLDHFLERSSRGRAAGAAGCRPQLAPGGDLFEHSHYFGAQTPRHPEMLLT